MSKELLEALEQIGRGRNLDRKMLVKALEFAINTASKKALGVENPIRVELDEDSGIIKAYTKKKVVDNVKDSKFEVSIDDFEDRKPKPKIGDDVEVEVDMNKYDFIKSAVDISWISQKIDDLRHDHGK